MRPRLTVEAEGGGTTTEPIPMSVREAQVHIQRKYMLRLELAQFDPADAHLTDAGACGPCVFRTGNQASLFGDVKGADVCTNPPCFERKTAAAWKLRSAAAAAAGVKVLDQEQSQRIFNAYGDARKVVHGSPYVDPKAEVPYEISPKNITWEKLLGKKGLAGVKTVLAQDGTGAARELIDRKAAVAQLKQLGKLDVADRGGADPKAKAAAEREERKRKVWEWAVLIACEAAAKKAEKPLPAKQEPALWLWLAHVHEHHLGTFLGEEIVLRRRYGRDDEDAPGSMSELLDTITETTARSLVVELALAQSSEAMWHRGEMDDLFRDGLRILGIEWAKAMKAAEEVHKGEESAAAKPAKATKKGAKKR
jgi:hypothetical protein